jgi:hypothetical protein
VSNLLSFFINLLIVAFLQELLFFFFFSAYFTTTHYCHLCHSPRSCIMKKTCVLATAFALFFVAGKAHAQANQSNVTVDTLTVVAQGGNTWKVTASGTITLGAKDTWVGAKLSFTDPNGTEQTPIVTQFSVPTPGNTTNYSCYVVAGTQGNWSFTISEFYTTGQTPGIANVTKKFTVP